MFIVMLFDKQKAG